MCEPRKSTAEEAVAHIVRRIQTDANFAWYMLGTECFAKCMAAMADCRGASEESIRQNVEKTAANRQQQPEVLTLRAKVESLQSQLARLTAGRTTHDARCDQRDGYLVTLTRVRDLIRVAEIMGEALTVDQLRDAIEGHKRPLGAR